MIPPWKRRAKIVPNPKLARPIAGMAAKAMIVGGMYEAHIAKVALPLK